MTVETNTAVQSYYLGGSGLKNITQWSGSVQMTYAPESNSVSATVEMSSNTAQIKISENGFTSAYRDNEAYSVTLNQPTVNIAEGSTITSAALSDSGNNVVLTIEGSPNTEFTVNYALSTNTITVSGKAEEEPVGTKIYLRNSLGWATPKAHIWINGGSSYLEWNDSGSIMTKVPDTDNIYEYTIPDGGYNMVVFHNGSDTQTDDLQIQENKIYDNQTGQWSEYNPPGGDTSAKRITVGVGSDVYSASPPGSNSYQLRYWGGTDGSQDVDCINLSTIETRNGKTYYMFSAEIPNDATGFKFHIGDNWYPNGTGGDGNAKTQSKVYVDSDSSVTYE